MRSSLSDAPSAGAAGGAGSAHHDAAGGTAECPCKRGKFLTNIFTAAMFGDAARVRHLLTAHDTALASKMDEVGYLPLIYAAQRGHDAVVDVLLTLGGADPAATSRSGCTALHRAAYSGHASTVRLLLLATPRGKAAVNAPDASTGDMRPAVSKAASQGHLAVCKVLVEEGGTDVTIRDKAGMLPHEVAEAGGHAECAAYLRGMLPAARGHHDDATPPLEPAFSAASSAP